jgi:hypothetical protein
VRTALALVLFVPSYASQDPRSAPDSGRSGVDAAVARGVAFLESEQTESGAFGASEAHEAGVTALAVYALLAAGVDARSERVLRALRRLAELRALGTYDVACLLLALAARDPVAHADWIEELTLDLLAWQNPDGDWGYPEGADLSNTQYAALGLRAASLAGADVPVGTWERLAAGTLRYAAGAGGFGYSASSTERTASMTAAGIGTLAICEERLSSAGALRGSLAERLRGRRRADFGFLAHELPRVARGERAWALYTLYGVERVGALAGIERIGKHDWYAVGRDALLDAQGASGGWEVLPGAGGGDVASTSFALLFLRRATLTAAVSPRPAPTGVDVVAGGERPLPEPGPDALVRLLASGRDPVGLWIQGFAPDVQRLFAWPDGELRVARVEYYSGAALLARVRTRLDDPAAPAELDARFPVQVRFGKPGIERVRARVVLRVPPASGEAPESSEAESGGEVSIESPELVLDLSDIGPEWARRWAEDRRRNLLPRAGPLARASTSASDERGARAAVDGDPRTSWLAEAEEARPALEIELAEPVLADVVVLSNARPRRPDDEAWGRALEVELRVNGGPVQRVSMPPDARGKARWSLHEPVLVERLELRLTWRVPGTATSAVGLAEVELQLR